LNPSAGEPHRDLGEVFQRKGEFDRALVEFGRAAELMPNDRRSHYMRARVLGKLGKQDEATREMQLAQKLTQAERSGPLSKALNNEGTKLLEERKVEQAIAKFRQALQLNPADDRAQYNLGVAYLLENQFSRATQELRAYLRSVPDDPDGRYYLGLAQLGNGQPAEAAGNLAQAVRLRPDDAPAHNAYGIALAKVKEFDRAAQQFEAARHLHPERSKYAENLACVEHRLDCCKLVP